ncbi:TlpA family protein disulfide reductase [Euzebya tangerina]|uniref:TlpA family protein disulfide reductase n=1 Tax=Euzebya tangerina TaxID=591198 RepID=UPI000E30DB45|nr:TlpA disulfide reductase family protein [Euzebya tangerina]
MDKPGMDEEDEVPTDDQALTDDEALGVAEQGESGPATTPSSAGAGRTIAVGALIVIILLGGAVLLLGGDDQADMPDNIADLLDPSATPDQPPGSLDLTDAVGALPEFDLTEFGADEVVGATSFLGDRPVVLNFWATWCAPCVAEMPDFQEVHEAGSEAFRLVGINTMDAQINAVPFVEELGITYDLATDETGEYFNLTGGFGMPTTLFVEPDGSVAYRHTGPLTIEQMTELLDEHLDVQVEV